MNIAEILKLINPEEKKTVEININMHDITYGDILPNPQVKSNGDYNNFSYQYKKKGSLLWSDTKPKDVGEYEIKVIAKETNKYKQIEKITTFRINKRKLNVNINVNSKVYDGTVNVSGYSSNFSNVVKGDNITVSINQNNLKFADKNVGTNKTVNTTNVITINGSKKDNYEIGDVLAKGNITKKEITIKDVLVSDKSFDGNADTKALVSFNGIIDGDDVSSVATAKFRDANIGNEKPVDIEITLTGNDKDNYNLTNKNIVRTANIIKKEKNNPDIKRKEIRYTILGTDKTYDSTTKAYIKFKLRNTGSDDVNIIADCEYEDANPGEKKIFIRNIKLTGKDAYKYKLTNPVIAVSGFITKQDGKQANPVIQNETIYGKNDGSIKADNSLEYRQKGTDIFKPLDNGINNLPSGKYEIRTKETNISNAGEIKEIELVPDKVYKITIINSDGSELIKPIKYNEKLQKPDNPIKKGYQFNGWYFDKDLKEKAIFDKIYNETDLSLYPKFIKASKYSGFYSSRSDKTTGVSGTWTKDINGKWELRIGNEQIKNRWAYVRNPYFDKTKGQNEFDWFHFNKEGKMDTGWFKDIDGNTYYLHNISDNTLGHMYTGWHWIKGTDGKERCYFFKDFSDGKKGALYRNAITPDGYSVNENGAWTIQGNEITR